MSSIDLDYLTGAGKLDEEKSWRELALELIGVVDYDMQKECAFNIEEDGGDSMVDEVAGWLNSTFGDSWRSAP